MDIQKKVWIRGDEENSEKVYQILENLGAKNFVLGGKKCNDSNNIYFINRFGHIDAFSRYSETAEFIMEEYQEIKLTDKLNSNVNDKLKELSNFEPFDKVLIRVNKGMWTSMKYWYLTFLFDTSMLDRIQIVLYNNRTKYLLNTKEEYDDYK